MLYFNVNVMGVKMTIKEYFAKMGRQKEVCKICGCTFENPCYTHENGYCYWIDDEHSLCSHCYYGYYEKGLEADKYKL